MSTLTAQAASLTGLNPNYSAASGGGDQFANTGKEVIHVKNGGGSSIDVTVDSQLACSQGFDHDSVVSVPAAGERIIGPFPKSRFNDANGYAQITYSGVTSVTIAVLQSSS